MTLRSLRIRDRRDAANRQTLLIALPLEHCEPIKGGCQCAFCKAHPDLTPMWDTLALSPDTRSIQYTWLVHNPDWQAPPMEWNALHGRMMPKLAPGEYRFR